MFDNDSHYIGGFGKWQTGKRLAVVLILAASVASCGVEGRGDPAQISVIATTTILGDIVSNVVGEDGTVQVLLPVGADPHDYQLSSPQVAELNRADLIVANGLGLEEGMDDVLKAARGDGVIMIELAQMLDPILFGGQLEDDDWHGGLDPHVWNDPLRVAQAGRLIAAELTELDDSIDWGSRADAYASALASLDENIVSILSSVKPANRKLVANHNSLGYFAERYGFDVIGTVVPGGSTLGAPSTEALARLVTIMRAENIDAIFVETTEPSVLAEALAAEMDGEVSVVELYSGSLGELGSGADTLIGMLQTNAARIAEALGE